MKEPPPLNRLHNTWTAPYVCVCAYVQLSIFIRSLWLPSTGQMVRICTFLMPPNKTNYLVQNQRCKQFLVHNSSINSLQPKYIEKIKLIFEIIIFYKEDAYQKLIWIRGKYRNKNCKVRKVLSSLTFLLGMVVGGKNKNHKQDKFVWARSEFSYLSIIDISL